MFLLIFHVDFWLVLRSSCLPPIGVYGQDCPTRALLPRPLWSFLLLDRRYCMVFSYCWAGLPRKRPGIPRRLQCPLLLAQFVKPLPTVHGLDSVLDRLPGRSPPTCGLDCSADSKRLGLWPGCRFAVPYEGFDDCFLFGSADSFVLVLHVCYPVVATSLWLW